MIGPDPFAPRGPEIIAEIRDENIVEFVDFEARNLELFHAFRTERSLVAYRLRVVDCHGAPSEWVSA